MKNIYTSKQLNKQNKLKKKAFKQKRKERSI